MAGLKVLYMQFQRSRPLGIVRAIIGSLGCLYALSIWGPGTVASAAEPAKLTEPIHITADRLVTDDKARTAEFSGNVRAVQGDTEVIADRLKLFYGGQTGEHSETESSDINRLEAHGEVKISFDNKVAVGDQAIYTTKDRKLVIQGPNSKVISGQDEIVGDKITFYRNDGRVILDSDTKTQVKAIIHSDQKGLN